MKKYETKGQSSFGNNQDRAKRHEHENESNKQKANIRNAPSISETRQRTSKEPRKK